MPKGFLTYDLAVALYRHVETIQARASLRDQLLRTSESVVLNIAEGSGRITRKDQARFYAIALGSLREAQAVFDLVGLQDKQVLKLADHVAACLYRLIHPKPKPSTVTESFPGAQYRLLLKAPTDFQVSKPRAWASCSSNFLECKEVDKARQSLWEERSLKLSQSFPQK